MIFKSQTCFWAWNIELPFLFYNINSQEGFWNLSFYESVSKDYAKAF